MSGVNRVRELRERLSEAREALYEHLDDLEALVRAAHPEASLRTLVVNSGMLPEEFDLYKARRADDRAAAVRASELQAAYATKIRETRDLTYETRTKFAPRDQEPKP